MLGFIRILRVLSLVLHLLARWMGVRIWTDPLAGIALLVKKIRCESGPRAIIFLAITCALTIFLLP
ncbi:MAG: hypothetical protein LBC42_03500 [Puniceicoccales bacterium]|nr:hypothetical protein [Puniceicoccales bacterium]